MLAQEAELSVLVQHRISGAEPHPSVMLAENAVAERVNGRDPNAVGVSAIAHCPVRRPGTDALHLRSSRLAERQQEQFLRTADLLDQKVDGAPGESASFARARPRNNAQRAVDMAHHVKLPWAQFGGEMVDLGCDGHGDASPLVLDQDDATDPRAG